MEKSKWKVSPQERVDTEPSPTSKPSKAMSVRVYVCVWVCVCKAKSVCDHVCMCEWAGGYWSVDKAKKNSFFTHCSYACNISSFKNTYKCSCCCSNMNKCAKPEQWYKYPAEIKGPQSQAVKKMKDTMD